MTTDVPIVYLTVEDLLLFVDLLGAGPVRDVGLLDSACNRPRATIFGEDAYPTLELKVGALLHSISGNHALVDGNKRLALLATVTFLRSNGAVYALTNDESFDLVMGVAEGRLDVPDIAERLIGSDE